MTYICVLHLFIIILDHLSDCYSSQVDHRGGLEIVMGGMVVQERAGDWGQETIKGGKVFRAGTWACIRTDGEPTVRECVESEESQKGRHWGVLHTEWNTATRARGHNI